MKDWLLAILIGLAVFVLTMFFVLRPGGVGDSLDRVARSLERIADRLDRSKF